MRSTLGKEVRNTQNPALGAALLWRFAFGYRSAHPHADHPPLHLLFIVLPMLFHEPTYEFVKSTQRSSGLHAFAAKFSESKHSKNDLLLAIHGRIDALRSLSLESLRVAQSGRLIQVNPSGRVICLTDSPTSTGDSAIKTLMNNAEKLGVWCSALTLHEVSIALKIRF